MRAPGLIRRFVSDTRGQDMIEYGLLAAIIAVAGVLLLPQIGVAMDAAFTAWGTGQYNQWCPDDPGGGTTCSAE